MMKSIHEPPLRILHAPDTLEEEKPGLLRFTCSLNELII